MSSLAIMKSASTQVLRRVTAQQQRSFSAAASDSMTESERNIALEKKYGADNYHPLPVVLTKGEGKFI
jgi:hypothetical protein